MKIIREVSALVFRFAGIPVLIRSILGRNKATIIFYHDPKPDVLKKHITYLARHYRFITLNRLVDAVYRKKKSLIPNNALVITLDDGHRNNYYLLDLLRQSQIRPTIYLCSHIVNTNRRFWFSLDKLKPGLFKKFRNPLRLKILKEKFCYEPQKEYRERQALNLDEIKEMNPEADFQSHSKFHPILPACDEMEAKEEIFGAKTALEKMIGKQIVHFSYPNGDYGKREVNILRESTYKSARTYDLGWNSIHTDPYRLKAMAIDDNASINLLSVQVVGLFRYFKYLFHGRWNGTHPRGI
jgi:peptidoglycan/xylan/chitin deacetylase (PgdA/CDA1 family)